MNQSEACPATGRSASACEDQTHALCWQGQREAEKSEAQYEALLRNLDESY